MTEDAIKLIQELGFPIAVSIGCMGLLGWVVKYILKEKVEDTLIRFDEKHENLQHRFDLLDRKITDEFGYLKKWAAEIKSDQKIIVDYILKGK